VGATGGLFGKTRWMSLRWARGFDGLARRMLLAAILLKII
jgi:hypothetical protein